MRTDRVSNISLVIIRLLLIISGMSPLNRQKRQPKSSRLAQARFWLLHANFWHETKLKCAWEQKMDEKKPGRIPAVAA
jgi:hypothetical protein